MRHIATIKKKRKERTLNHLQVQVIRRKNKEEIHQVLIRKIKKRRIGIHLVQMIKRDEMMMII